MAGRATSTHAMASTTKCENLENCIFSVNLPLGNIFMYVLNYSIKDKGFFREKKADHYAAKLCSGQEKLRILCRLSNTALYK